MRTTSPRETEAKAGRGGLEAVLPSPWLALGIVAAVVVAMSWQFITDAARAVPAFDTAYYQWRVEFLLQNDPGALIELRGATGALAGGYRIAEPVIGALMRTVGLVGAVTPTIILSVGFRVLSALGMAAFAWRHRRNWPLFYISILAIPALYLLQRFFGYLDNFFTLSLLTGTLLLLEAMRTSWPARIAAVLFMFLAGLSHPTTLAIFLLSFGAVAVYRLIRERSFRAVLRSEGPVLIAGAAAVLLTAAFWLGGLWGPTSSFSDAAVPPPEDVEFFVDRSVGVLQNMTPYLLIPLLVIGLVHLVIRMWRDREYFSEVTLAWTLPLAGMFGFLIGAAYPYFRFFNATLAPLLVASIGLWLLVRLGRRLRSRVGVLAPVVAVTAVAAVLGVWWFQGLSAWNSGMTWLTPEIREATAAMDGYLDTAEEGTRAVVVTDAQPENVVPYGQYKEFTNATYAGIEGEHIDEVVLYFGTIEDFRAGRPSTSSDQPYNDISEETSAETSSVLEGGDPVVVFAPTVFNEESPNADMLSECPETECVPVASTLSILAEQSEVDEAAVGAGRRAAEEARGFAADPPGPVSGLGGTLLAVVGLALLFVVPGFPYWLAIPGRTWVDGLVLVPLLSLTLATTAGVVLVAILRQPFSAGVGWASWAIAVLAGLGAWLGARRRPAASVTASRARLGRS
jgi:hypothetical protein